MTSRYPILYRSIQGIAFAAVLISLLIPGWLSNVQLIIALGMILLIGIPHGATDYLIFQQLSRPLWGSRELTRFYVNYILLMAGFALLWWLFPVVALLVFLGISIYHFGQSNWNYVAFESKAEGAGTHLLWGSFVLFVPILWHYEAAAPIISNIMSAPAPYITEPWREAVSIVLLVLNLWLCVYYYVQSRITRKEFMDEVVNLFALALLLINLPLLLGFAIYFVCWHSLSSMMDQIRFFRRQVRSYSISQYIRNALPLSLAAIGSLAIFALVQIKMDISLNIGMVFVFISVVTLPHMILIDQLYQEGDPSLAFNSMKEEV
ncbi:MAG: Brp/Blh family beta-carotene 15,15'-dioxygenase [Phaeodactylibacter sp.]|uniref:Brp/Blh family beta-carotene 15,15'-dioxygenase n=1 Tax=Phaeodactylibacter sp. TaxID=1940289 RepID=UPI0032EDFDAB